GPDAGGRRRRVGPGAGGGGGGEPCGGGGGAGGPKTPPAGSSSLCAWRGKIPLSEERPVLTGPPQAPRPPRRPPPDDDAEIFVEQPTTPSGVMPLPESDDDAATAVAEFENERDTQPGAQGGDMPLIAEPLPEMYAEMWQAGIQALVTVPDDAPPVWPT